MILIIGGAGQGKLDYVLQKTGYGPAQVARTPEEARTRPVFAGLEDWPELDEAADFRTQLPGGHGAVYEAIRRLLIEQEKLDSVMERYRR